MNNKYEEALKRAKRLYNDGNSPVAPTIEAIFPELKESESESIRKALIKYFTLSDDNADYQCCGIYCKDIVAWLEKQGSEPNWCHHKVDLSNCSEEYRNAYYDGWNNCNMQHSQCKSELDDVVKCLINGMKFYYEDNEEATWGTDKWSMPVKHIIEVLEKQGEQKVSDDKAEPKFKVGDWVVHNMSDGRKSIRQIVEMTNKSYVLDGGCFDAFYFNDLENDYHLWTIQDAKDGDVLAEKGDVILMFRGIGNTKWDNVIDYHCYYECYREDFIVQEGVKYWGNTENGQLKPATNEQRDLLFSKIKEAGYEWNAEKKELKKIEHKPDKWNILSDKE